MSEIERPVVEGVVVADDDACHPMTFSGSCLRCGRADWSPGCHNLDLGRRVRALQERGLCARVADLLTSTDIPADLRQVEALTDEQIAELNAAARTRAG